MFDLKQARELIDEVRKLDGVKWSHPTVYESLLADTLEAALAEVRVLTAAGSVRGCHECPVKWPWTTCCAAVTTCWQNRVDYFHQHTEELPEL